MFHSEEEEPVTAQVFIRIPRKLNSGKHRKGIKKILTIDITDVINVWTWESDNWVELYN